jgi:hypothetical protein
MITDPYMVVQQSPNGTQRKVAGFQSVAEARVKVRQLQKKNKRNLYTIVPR